MSIKYIFWDDDSGYGISARQLIKYLLNNGIKVSAVGIKRSHRYQKGYKIVQNITAKTDYDIVFIHSSPYYLKYFIEPGKINIVYCTWETTRLPEKWVTEINRCSAVFVPSQFNKECFERSGVTRPTYLLPHISEFMGLSAAQVPSEKIQSPFTFYSIGMWTNRKNNLALIDAFSQTFQNGENVRLIIKTSKKDYTEPAIRLFKKSGYVYHRNLLSTAKIKKALKNDPRIKLITREWPSSQIADLHVAGDCYISLSKSEGWGLGPYEAAWFGKPVVITGFGGQLDFLPKDLALLLPYELKLINDPVWTDYMTEAQEWAEITVGAAEKAMKEIYTNQLKFKDKGIALKQSVASRFNVSDILESFIYDLNTTCEGK
ncbi:MAG: glycosyltransferase family 4 protein [Saprospiraceae bacterium]|nr:glycosyltransferase family 4 protein [Saprospiraceae bacterium]